MSKNSKVMNCNHLVSFCLLVYNQKDFIEDALNGAFAQNYSPMEIIISDDNSTDGTFDIIKRMVANYKGEHIIRINRNEKNLGIAGNVNKVCYELAKGNIILLAGGDDISMPDRTKESVEIFDKYPEVVSMSCESLQVDKALNPMNFVYSEVKNTTIMTIDDYLNNRNFLLFPGDSRAIRTDILRTFPPLTIAKGEDIYFFVRTLMLGSVAYVRKPLVKRRVHGNNSICQRMHLTGLKITKLQMSEDINFALTHHLISEKLANRLYLKVKQLNRIFFKWYLRSNLKWLIMKFLLRK